MTDLDKFKHGILVDVETGCWNWLRGKTSYGYGVFYINRKQVSTHRFSYLEFVGSIPSGFDIDHLCRNRQCCNPSHLEAVTRQVNLLRGETLTAKNASKTHCPKGHEYTPENLIPKKNKPAARDCKTCNLIRSKNRYNQLKTNPEFIKHKRSISKKSYMKTKQIIGGAN